MNMQQTCDPDRLEAFVRGELSEQQESELTAHLDQCAACGEELERRVAAADQWREAGELLTHRTRRSHVMDLANDPSTTGSLATSTTCAEQMDQVVDMLAPTDDPEMLGRIGGYEVSGVIGCGGMGVVFKAHDRSLDRVVAIKVMAPHLAGSGAARKRFARESKAAAAVLHPNVIAIHCVADDPKLPYLVMPYIGGASLQKRIEADGPLCTQDTLRIGQQIAAGLAAAHAQGLVHRDIKPANILLERGVERVTITDFGLARAVDDATMTRSGVIAGTPQYMSPEQARGESIDHRSDLFSLGSVLYMMCAGHSPFRAETTFGILRRITDNQPRPLREINPDVPEWLWAIIEKLHAKEPSERFQSAEEVAELLEGCLAHLQQPATTPLPTSVEQLSQLLPVATTAPQPAKKQLRQLFYNLPPIGKFIAAAAGAFALFFAGILIVLELDKGTLTIESELDNVPIRIMQGEEVVKSLTISRNGQSTRVAAGQYTVEIEHSFDKAMVENGMVTLSRGGNEVVKLTQTDPSRTTVVTYSVRALLEGDSELSIESQLKSLMDLIRSTIAPDSWKVDEVSIVPYPENRCLVIRQTETNHKAISKLIEELNGLVPSRIPENVRHLMEHIANPAMDDLLKAMNGKPAGKLDWEAIKGKSLTISEVGNLLMQRGERFQSEWIAASEALRDNGKSLFAAAQSRDASNAKSHLAAISDSCTNCHRVFRNPPNASVGSVRKSDGEKQPGARYSIEANTTGHRHAPEVGSRIDLLVNIHAIDSTDPVVRTIVRNALVTATHDSGEDVTVSRDVTIELQLTEAEVQLVKSYEPLHAFTFRPVEAGEVSSNLEVFFDQQQLRKKTSNASEARTLDDITSVYNEQTRQLRTELFDPAIPDLTITQLREAMLYAAEQYRKQGRVEISAALKTSVETNRLADRLTFMGVSGTMSDGFRQITPQLNFEAASNSALMVVLGKAELRYSRKGWSSKDWGDIHPPITGKWGLVSVEQRGETLNDDAFNQWQQVHSEWMALTIGEISLTMAGDNAAKLDFEIDYDAGLLPQYAIRQDGNTKYSGVLMGNGFIDDTTLVVAVDLEGNSTPQTFHTTDGKSTNLTYRRHRMPDIPTVFQSHPKATDRLKKAFESAATVARKDDTTVNTLHLMAALMRDGSLPEIAEVAKRKKISMKDLINRCDDAARVAERLFKATGDRGTGVSQATSVEQWKELFEASELKAKEWKHDYLGPAHLLMAFIADDPLTKLFLKEQGIEAAEIRDVTMQIYFSPGPDAPVVRPLP